MNDIKAGLKVKVSIRAGGITRQHSRTGVKVRVGVRAGAILCQHNGRVLTI